MSTITSNTEINSTNFSDYTWPVTINANVTVTFGSDLTLTSTNHYFIMGGANVVINGNNYNISLTVDDYPGLIKNRQLLPSSTAYQNITIKNINMSATVYLPQYTGPFCQQWARYLTYINCSFTGYSLENFPINGSKFYSSGFLSSYTQYCTLNNCRYIGDIAMNCFGLMGANVTNCIILNSYVTGYANSFTNILIGWNPTNCIVLNSYFNGTVANNSGTTTNLIANGQTGCLIKNCYVYYSSDSGTTVSISTDTSCFTNCYSVRDTWSDTDASSNLLDSYNYVLDYSNVWNKTTTPWSLNTPSEDVFSTLQIIKSNTNLTDTTTYSWPLYITSGVTLTIINDLTFTSSNQYIVINSNDVTIAGSNNTITISGITNYPGLIKNGSSSSIGYSNCTINRLTIARSNSSTLLQGAGWLTQSYFGNTTAFSNIIKCIASGEITGYETGDNYCGGIVGSYARFINIVNSYTTGSIGTNAGGIIGSNTLNNINIINCYTIGSIGTNAGGIISKDGVNTDASTINIVNCYSSGSLGTNAGGINGLSSTSTNTNCYSSNGSWSNTNNLVQNLTYNGVTYTEIWNQNETPWLLNAYKYNTNTFTNDITITSEFIDELKWPVTVVAGVTVTFGSNLTLTLTNQYFIIGGNNVTIDGNNYTVNVSSIINSSNPPTEIGFSGLIRNGYYLRTIIFGIPPTTTMINTPYNNALVKNISVVGGSTFSYQTANGGAYICQQYFGKNTTGCVIQNCNATGVSQNGYIIGRSCENLTVIGCYTTSNIGTGGGIFGFGCVNCTAISCYTTGTIGNTAGGIYGRSNICKAINCYSTGNIKGGGAGIFYGNTFTKAIYPIAINCYSTGNADTTFTGTYYGIIGPNTGGVSINCYAYGTGINEIGGSVTNCYLSSTWSDTDASSNLVNTLTYDGYSYSNIWINPGTNTAWTLDTLNRIALPNIITTNTTISNSDIINYMWPVTISANITVTFSSNLILTNENQYFIIGGNNVTINGNNYTVDVSAIKYAIGITPIGAAPQYGFKGLIQNAASNFTTIPITPISDGYNNALIKNIGVLSSNDYTNSNYRLANFGGFICQASFGRNSTGCTIQNCYSTGWVSTGGIIGNYCENLTIKECYSTGIITSNGGGIIGRGAKNCTIINCYSTGGMQMGASGIISGGTASIAKNINCVVINCYATGNKINTGNGEVWGIFYSIANTLNENCFAINCYASGTDVIGIAGTSGITVTNCYLSSTWSDTDATTNLVNTLTYDNKSYSNIWNNPGTNTAWTLNTLTDSSTSTILPAPTIGTASSVTSSSASISFTAPTGAASGTTYSAKAGGVEYGTASYPATSISVTGLSASTTYSFTITATNTEGTSDASSSLSVTTLLSAPTIGTASSVTSSSASISFTAPTGAASGTTYSAKAGGVEYGTASYPATSISVTGLSASTTYSFTITATNTAGTSNASSSLSVTTSGSSGAPIIGTATSITLTSASISFTAPETASIGTTYNAIAGGVTYGTASYPDTSILVTGLTTGSTYSFTINAIIDDITSDPSSSLSVTTLLGAPTIGTASSITSSTASISFTAPTGAAEGTTYTAKADGVTYGTASYSATSISLTGLSGNTDYSFTITATNAGGDSDASSSLSITTALAAPTIGTFSNVSTTAATLGFTAPSGAASGITYSAKAGGVEYGTASYPATSISVTGLSANTTYSFTVTATNTVGTSDASSSLSVTTALSAPVIENTSTTTTTTATVQFTAPTGAATGTSYRLTKNGIVYGSVDYPATSINVTSLTSGESYLFALQAINSNGTSDLSNTTTLTTILNSPTDCTASAVVDTSATITFTPPSGASVTTTYDAMLSGVSYTSISYPATSFSLTGLTSNTSYSFVLTATNLGGTSANSTTITFNTTLSAPTNLVLNSIGLTTANISFTVPDRASTGTTYALTANNISYGTISHPSSTFSLTGLVSGSTYQFIIKATNINGTSPASSILSVTTLLNPPTINSTNAIASYTATLLFTPPSGAATGTTYNAISNGTVYGTASYPSSVIQVSGLSALTSYSFRMVAINAGGTSNTSLPISFSTAIAPPTITNTSSITTTTAVVTFTAPASAGNGTTYAISANDVVYGTASYPATTISLSNLLSGSTYLFGIKATNFSGTSSPSSFTILTVPGPPTIGTASLITGTTLTIGFTPPPRVGSGTTYDFILNKAVYQSVSYPATSILITGLTPSTSYSFTVKATNSSGSSSSVGSLNTKTALPSPTIGTATVVTTTTATVSFTAPTGAAAKTTYNIISNNIVCGTAVYPATVITATGLTGNTVYSFTLKAINAIGTSNSSSSISVTTALVAPTIGTASAISSTTAVIQFTAPEGVGLGTGVSYGVYASGKLYGTVSYPATSITAIGLTANTVYPIVLKVTNPNGTSIESSILSIKTALAPPVIGASSLVSSSTAVVAFKAPTGAAIGTTYNAISGDVIYGTATFPATTISLSGLSVNTAYSFVVKAVNTSGTSASSSALSITTALAEPVIGTVSNVSTTTATIGFTEPEGATTSTIYTVYSGIKVIGTVTSPATSINITGLKENTPYTFIMKAAIGTRISRSSSSINITTALAAPKIGKASSITNSSAVIGFTPPAGIAQGTTFILLANGITYGTAMYTASSITATNLTANTLYSFTIKAVNANGTSIASAALSVTTALDPPTIGVASEVSSTTAKISFTGPTGSATKTTYSAIANNVSYGTAAYPATTISLSKLTANTSYSFVLKSINANGTSNASSTLNITTALSAPIIGTVTSKTSRTVTIGFTASVGASEDTVYKAYVGTTYYTETTNGSTSSTSKSITITNLTPNTTYAFILYAVNSNGTSSASSVLTVIMPTSAPTIGTASSVTSSAASISLTAPVEAGTGTTYDAYANGIKYGSGAYPATTVSLTGLTANTQYVFTINVVNKNGTSDSSSTLSMTTALAAPTITAVNTVRGTTGTVVFTEPVGAATGTTYSVIVGAVTYGTASYPATSVNISGLKENTTYALTIKATNSNGTSTASSAFSMKTALAAPKLGASSAITATSATLAFTAPVGAAAGTTYSVLSNGTSYGTAVFGAKTINISGLITKTTYAFSMTATNTNGTSNESTTVSITTI